MWTEYDKALNIIEAHINQSKKDWMEANEKTDPEMIQFHAIRYKAFVEIKDNFIRAKQ